MYSTLSTWCGVVCVFCLSQGNTLVLTYWRTFGSSASGHYLDIYLQLCKKPFALWTCPVGFYAAENSVALNLLHVCGMSLAINRLSCIFSFLCFFPWFKCSLWKAAAAAEKKTSTNTSKLLCGRKGAMFCPLHTRKIICISMSLLSPQLIHTWHWFWMYLFPARPISAHLSLFDA